MSALGFVKAVTEGGDHWLAYMPRRRGPRSGQVLGSVLSSSTEAAMRETTHDQLDAARMRLCNSDDDVIRRGFLQGEF